MKLRHISHKILANPFPYICYLTAIITLLKNIIYICNYDINLDPLLLWGATATICYFTLASLFHTKHRIILFFFYIGESCLRIIFFTQLLRTNINYEILLISFLAVFYLFSEYHKNHKISYIAALLLIASAIIHTFIFKIIYYRPLSMLTENQILFSKVESYSNLTITSIQLLIASICSSISLKKMHLKNEATQKKLEYITCHDILTGLMNRYRAFTFFSSCETRKINEGIEYGIAILDIDDFKQINDVYGHDAGDAVLKNYTAELRKRLPLQNKIARWGGEEFLIIFPKITSETIFELDTIRELLSLTPFHYNGQIIHVTATYGISSSRTFSSATEVLNDADNHLYIGKQNGKNRLVVSEKF